MKISDYELYRDLLQRNSGLAITPDKSYLLSSRLTPVSRKWGYPSLDAMTIAMRGIPELPLIEAVIEAMADPDTSFFRDKGTINSIMDVLLPVLVKECPKNSKRLRIWSTGCSTGQEPYSIAIALKEREELLASCQVEFLATDFSNEVLRRARTATYSQFDVQRGLPVNYLLKHFDEVGDSWRLHDDVQALVRFDTFNLLEPMDELGLFHVIFCRNVLGLFVPEVRETVFNRLADALEPNGFLVLDSSENGLAANSPFEPLKECPGVHILKEGDYNMKGLEQAFIKHSLKTSVSAVNARRAKKGP